MQAQLPDAPGLAQRVGEQVDLGARVRHLSPTHEKADHGKRQDHHGGRGVEIERERQRQLVALAEAVGAGGADASEHG